MFGGPDLGIGTARCTELQGTSSSRSEGPAPAAGERANARVRGAVVSFVAPKLGLRSVGVGPIAFAGGLLRAQSRNRQFPRGMVWTCRPAAARRSVDLGPGIDRFGACRSTRDGGAPPKSIEMGPKRPASLQEPAHAMHSSSASLTSRRSESQRAGGPPRSVSSPLRLPDAHIYPRQASIGTKRLHVRPADSI